MLSMNAPGGWHRQGADQASQRTLTWERGTNRGRRCSREHNMNRCNQTQSNINRLTVRGLGLLTLVLACLLEGCRHCHH